MDTHTPEQQFHDKATRGESLSADERARLAEWYAQLGREEAALTEAAPPARIATLRAQIEDAVAQLATVVQHIQLLMAENAAVRLEIAALQRLLAQRPAAQPA